MIRTVFSVLFLSLSVFPAAAQKTVLTLEECRQAAVTRSPLTVRRELAGLKRQAKDRAASSALIPQVEINAQGSYQNEVPKFPGDLPLPIAIDLPKDQYRATVDLNQVIYGGSSVRNAKRVNAATETAEKASLEVQLDRLRDRINDIYLGILMAERQLEVNALMRKTLAADIEAVTARVAHGTATGGMLAALTARMIELSQQRAELEGTRSKLATALTELTGLPVAESTVLEIPAVPDRLETGEPFLHRTELKLYAGQREVLNMQDKWLNSKSNPKLSLFASGGYGRPGYNFLDRDFAPMAIGGLRLNVPLTGWATTQREKRANRIARGDIDQQQRDFERNVTIQAAQYVTDIEKLREVTAMDPEIVKARTAVRERALAQLEKGIITESEYLTEFNNEAAARVNAEVNALRLVQAWIGYDAARGVYR
ncbi:TolC family protein [uncultured Rikenella sp.]|uniref:TolC family protein n=1 Tax=uncultured Rikenella sp. TaxID=368003 RepID=UPI002613343F|nr:TolC family protein [uncultured Rikenella sp.]